MPVIREHANSRASTGNPPTERWIYNVWYSEDPAAVKLLVNATAPLTSNGLMRLNVNCTPQADFWTCEVEYGLGLFGDPGYAPDEDAPLGTAVTFDLTGGTAEVTQSLETVETAKSPDDPDDPPNYERAINVSKDGVSGVTIGAPKSTVAESWLFPLNSITYRYMARLEDMAWTMNANPWRNRDAGEILFMGATGGAEGDFYRITYHFLRGKNKRVRVSDRLDEIQKDAHHYLWCTYEPLVRAGLRFQVPKVARVERMYDYTDFAELGIGQ